MLKSQQFSRLLACWFTYITVTTAENCYDNYWGEEVCLDTGDSINWTIFWIVLVVFVGFILVIGITVFIYRRGYLCFKKQKPHTTVHYPPTQVGTPQANGGIVYNAQQGQTTYINPQQYQGQVTFTSPQQYPGQVGYSGSPPYQEAYPTLPIAPPPYPGQTEMSTPKY